MYERERVIIDIRKYNIDDFFCRYKEGRIVFYERHRITKSQWEKQIPDIMWALKRGIPFPPIYASELQTGEFLIFDKNNKLRILLEYLKYGDKKTDTHFDSELFNIIMYSPLIVYVIEYMNPKYMHMQVGNFVEGWSATQEQEVRNILYGEGSLWGWEEFLWNKRCTEIRKLNIQYNLTYFSMIYFFKNNELKEYWHADKYQLLEITFKKLRFIGSNEREFLYREYERYSMLIKQSESVNYMFKRIGIETRTKYLCFLYLCEKIQDLEELSCKLRRELKIQIKNQIEKCDMSYEGIQQTIEFLDGVDKL